MSTPAASAFIRKKNSDHGENYCVGGILLTASHNPAGEDEDFGIKFNSRNGGPALENFTNKLYEVTKTIKHYKITSFHNDVDLSHVGIHDMGQIEGSD